MNSDWATDWTSEGFWFDFQQRQEIYFLQETFITALWPNQSHIQCIIITCLRGVNLKTYPVQCRV
jgi:hypothetical protein